MQRETEHRNGIVIGVLHQRIYNYGKHITGIEFFVGYLFVGK